MQCTTIAVWKPTEVLLHNIRKLNEQEYKIVAFFSDESEESRIDHIPVKRLQELRNADFDYLLIPFENFRNTKQELNQTYGLCDRVYTFEEFWVKDCEEIITQKYYHLWKSMKDAGIRTFEGKTVLIAGGGSGIGRECAFAFACAGARVIVAGRDEKKLQAVCESAAEAGECQYIRWDVRKTNEYEERLREAESKFGFPIDVFINSAGIWDGSNKNFFEITSEEFDAVIETNLKAGYFMNQCMARYFIDKRIRGHIVNIISNVGTLPTVKPYGVSKWGMAGLTRGLGLSLAEYGITVNGVAPGAVATSMSGWQKGDCPARRASKNGRISFPCEVAQTVLHLAGFTGENLVGEIVVCDGGDKAINMRL